MGFSEHLKLTEENVQENKSKRTSFKLLGNAMLGKFSQRPQYSQTLYVNSQEEMEKAFREHEIVDVLPVSEKICELEILPLLNQHSTKSTTGTRASNCIIGAFVTAYARIQLHKDILTLKARGYEPYYCDTDAIIFRDPNPSLLRPMPLSLSPCLGDYKHELGNQVTIQSFACLARKTYSISYFDKSKKQNKICVKSSGLTLSSSLAQKALNSKDFEVLLRNSQKTEMSIKIPQLRSFMIRDSGNVQHRISDHKLSNKINIQRIVQSESTTSNTYTLPFGYDFKNTDTK